MITLEPSAVSRWTFSVTVVPSPRVRSSTTTSAGDVKRNARQSRYPGTEAPENTTTREPSRWHAACSPSLTDSWSSMNATRVMVLRLALRHRPGEGCDRLDVMRVGEEVHRVDPRRVVAVRAEHGQVAREGHRVACDVHDSPRPQPRYRLDDLAAGARSGRVEHHGTARESLALYGGCLGRKRREPAIHAGGHRTRADPCGEVLPRVLGGARIRL